MFVDFEDHKPVAVIVLNRPDKWNAVDPLMAADLARALERLESEPAFWVGVLTAVGPAFSVGADLKAGPSRDETGRIPRAGNLNPIIMQPRVKPLVAAVEAVAAGGGLELVLECDVVVASRLARFLLPEVTWSMVAAAGAAIRLHHYLPRNIAMDMLLTGAPLGAEDAHRWGLVNRLVEPGAARSAAMAYAREICEGAPTAVRETRRAFLAACRGDEDRAWEICDAALEAAMRSADHREGIRAFLERRPPSWQGT